MAITSDPRTLGADPLNQGLPGLVKHGYEDLRDRAIGNTWRGMWNVASSGFGKGVLAAAALFIVGGAAGAGLLTAAEMTQSVSGVFDAALKGGMTGASLLFTEWVGAGAALGLGVVNGVRSMVNEHVEVQQQIEQAKAAQVQRQIDEAEERGKAQSCGKSESASAYGFAQDRPEPEKNDYSHVAAQELRDRLKALGQAEQQR